MRAGQVDTTIAGGIGWLIFDNPARRNAMTAAMWRQTAQAAAAFAENPAVRVVVMRGAGAEAFVSGADISEFEQARADSTGAQAYEAASAAAFAALEGLDKPLVAMIAGFCFGGGVAIAMKADLRLAQHDALFSIPAARLGIAYPPDSVRDLVGLVGPANAKDILFSARRFDAAEAWRMGLVNAVSAPGALATDVDALAATLVENAPLSMLAAKACVDHVARGADDRAEALVARCFDSADYAEGRRAFMEKRRPTFQGR